MVESPGRHTRNRRRATPHRSSFASTWHRVLEHDSDLELEIGAPELGPLLLEAGRALASVLLGRGSQRMLGPARDIEVHSTDREALLVDWINELLFLAETTVEVPVEIEILELTETHVHARARGIPVDMAPSLVKAATHHGLRIVPCDDGLVARVILDL